MRWSDVPWRPAPRVLRQFAALWLVFFAAHAAWQGLVRGRPALGCLLAALAFAVGLLGLVRPSAVRPVFVGWSVLVFPAGWLTSRLALLVLFYGLFTPVAVCFRLLGRDGLGLSRPTGPTCWAPLPAPAAPADYFRQF
jgi:hypothetical protein